MKKTFIILFIALAASVGTNYASPVQIGDLYYNLDETNKTAEVTGSDCTGDIIIPVSVVYNSITYSVTSIGTYAFVDCSSLTSIEIPNSVTSIGEGAFSGCSNLTGITIPNSVTSIGAGAFSSCSGLTSINVESDNSNYSSVDGVLFNKDVTTLIQYPRGKKGAYIIPNSVTSIGDFALFKCTNLTAITIPNSVTSIGTYAFAGCTGLTSIELPNSVTSIGEAPFYDCTSLTSPIYNAHLFVRMPYSYSGAYSIPDGIESIVGGAFSACSNLTSVTIPNSVTTIGDHAFSDCYALTGVTIPQSVTSIEEYAFAFCPGLTSITIPESVTSLGVWAFTGCSGLTSVEIPNSVTSIGEYTFYGCSGLTSVTIPNSVTSIGGWAFAYCSNLSVMYNNAETPQTIKENVFNGVNKAACHLVVPAESYTLYTNAPVWQDFIIEEDTTEIIGPTDIPTSTDLAAAGYHVNDSLVVCLYFDVAPCYDVYFPGNYRMNTSGGWSTDITELERFEPLQGFPGWYVVEVPYVTNAQGKPVQLTFKGIFNWDYQSGDANAWIYKGGNQATVISGYPGEADIRYPAPGCYIYEIAYWKNHNNPCELIPHNYTIQLYAPDACEDMKPAIIGSFNNWNFVPMNESLDAQFRTVYTYTIYDANGSSFKFADSELGWNNELQYYDEVYGYWRTFDNYILPAVNQDTTIVFDYSDNEKYRFEQCQELYDVLVYLVVPDGAPKNIEIIGSFDDWVPTPMLYNTSTSQWTAEIQAKESDYFFIREQGTWDNMILTYSDYDNDWYSYGWTMSSVWNDGTEDLTGYKIISLDLSSATYYKWAQPSPTAIEDVNSSDNLVGTRKLLRNGQIYILRGDKTYTLTGQLVK
ncbi:MAG: leucine-rich repeat domain-containing protein [Paludibacteraceae bacterium]|nr:leucine-rich repeat domain-containing protein [Paludibacteraceae bacterium]